MGRGPYNLKEEAFEHEKLTREEQAMELAHTLPADAELKPRLVGLSQTDWINRKPFFHHPPVESQVIFWCIGDSSRRRWHNCFWCDRTFLVLNADGSQAQCMCCSIKCSHMFRGIEEPRAKFTPELPPECL